MNDLCEMREDEAERKIREEIRELIFIILTLLLSLAFLTQFEIGSEIKDQTNKGIPILLSSLFILGAIGILFCFLFI